MLWAFISELRGFISKNVAVPLQTVKDFNRFRFHDTPQMAVESEDLTSYL